MTRPYSFWKTMLYAAATLMLLCLSASWQQTMRREGQLERGFSLALFGCFAVACCLIGIAIYAYLGFVRKRRPAYRADVLFFLLTGCCLMVLTLVCFLKYGGLSGTFQEEGYVAANFMIVTLSALPLPFLVRTAVTAFSRGEVRRGYRRAMWIVTGLLFVLYIVLLAAGGMFHTLTYTAAEGAGI